MKTKKTNKKAAINLTVGIIIMVIIGILIIYSLVVIYKSSFVKISGVIEKKIVVKPPVAIISSPIEDKYHMTRSILFDGSQSYDEVYKIEKYFWDVNGDGIIDGEGKILNYSYPVAGHYNVTLYVMNEKGAIGKASKKIHIFSSNIHPISRFIPYHLPYPRGGRKGGEEGGGGGGPSPQPPPKSGLLFMISDKTKTAESNWRDILRMVPITRWNQMDGEKQYLFVVYHYTSTMTNDDVVRILEDVGATEARIFGDLPPGVVPGQEGSYLITHVPMEEYFNYWDPYLDVVIVDYDNYESGLISSLFASLLNAPLVFLNSENLDYYKQYINGKTLYVVGRNGDDTDVDDGVLEWINNTNQTVIHYKESSLRNITINPFYALSSEVRFITTEANIPQETVCIDSDGGRNYYINGTTIGPSNDPSYNNVLLTDYCLDNNVTEFYCNNGMVSTSSFECNNGCQNGACIGESDNNIEFSSSEYNLSANPKIFKIDISNIGEDNLSLTGFLLYIYGNGSHTVKLDDYAQEIKVGGTLEIIKQDNTGSFFSQENCDNGFIVGIIPESENFTEKIENALIMKKVELNCLFE